MRLARDGSHLTMIINNYDCDCCFHYTTIILFLFIIIAFMAAIHTETSLKFSNYT